ncbi:hypothetical protein FB451DRAFT_1442762 [Mycena latifolia]|nr:hypothetical protein FB451DRAFT_1442762 [Mycena latifolia]
MGDGEDENENEHQGRDAGTRAREEHKKMRKYRGTRDSRRIARGDAREEEKSGERAIDGEEAGRRGGSETLYAQEGLSHRENGERAESGDGCGIDKRPRGWEGAGYLDAKNGAKAEREKNEGQEGKTYRGASGARVCAPASARGVLSYPPFPRYASHLPLDSIRRRLRVLKVPSRSSWNAGDSWEVQDVRRMLRARSSSVKVMVGKKEASGPWEDLMRGQIPAIARQSAVRNRQRAVLVLY